VTEIGQVYVVVPASGQRAEGPQGSNVKSRHGEDCHEGDPCSHSLWASLSVPWATPVRHNSALPLRRRIQNAPVPPNWANGKPDLSRFRGKVSRAVSRVPARDMFRRCTPFQTKNCMEWTNQSEDWVFMSATRLGRASAAVQARALGQDESSSTSGRTSTTRSMTASRSGFRGRVRPHESFQTENDITMLYRGGATAAEGTRSSA